MAGKEGVDLNDCYWLTDTLDGRFSDVHTRCDSSGIPCQNVKGSGMNNTKSIL